MRPALAETTELGAARARYEEILAAIGDRAAEIQDRPLVNHWPHVGSAYRGLLIVGQALRGWSGEWQAPEAQTPAGRERILESSIHASTESTEPLWWVPSHRRVRIPLLDLLASPRRGHRTGSGALVRALCLGEPVSGGARAATRQPDGRAQGGPGSTARRSAAPCLATMLDARHVVVIAGPTYWYRRRTGDLWTLERPREAADLAGHGLRPEMGGRLPPAVGELSGMGSAPIRSARCRACRSMK